VPVRGALTAADEEVLVLAAGLTDRVRGALERLAFHEALDEIWRVIRAGDGYIDHQAPWSLRKTDLVRMNTVLSVLVEVLRTVGVLLQPFMPGSASRLLDQLGVVDRSLAGLEVPLEAGVVLPAPVGLFPRFVEESSFL